MEYQRPKNITHTEDLTLLANDKLTIIMMSKYCKYYELTLLIGGNRCFRRLRLWRPYLDDALVVSVTVENLFVTKFIVKFEA